MTSLQMGLIIGGVVLVLGVLVYNWYQERRLRARLAAAVGKRDDAEPAPGARVEPNVRVEPSLAAKRADASDAPRAAAPPVAVAENLARVTPESAAEPVQAAVAAAEVQDIPVAAVPMASLGAAGGDRAPQPDADIECIVTLQPARPVGVGVLASALHARLGKPLRWFGRDRPGAPWQLLGADTKGEWIEFAACLLLADRSGAATRAQLDRFVRLGAEQAAALTGACVAPDPEGEVARAETLDRMCADVDVQIGLTLLKPGPALIPGTRLRGVAEAAGFHLGANGRFEWIQDDTASVLYVLQNFRSEPFTTDSLRVGSVPGVVFVLDVPRIADPVRTFDQMKSSAKRMAQTLDAALVDDNRRPLTDPALAAIREQVRATVAALHAMKVDPGSPRALALFGG